MKEQQVIEGLKPICLCKGIKKAAFLKHMQDGIRSVDGLKKSTGAGSGSCKGKRCSRRIAELLAENTD